MPQISIDYSRGLESELDLHELANVLHRAVVGTGRFPVGAIRTYLRGCDYSLIGDEAAGNGFINIQIRIGPGRSAELKTSLTKLFMEAVEAKLADHLAKRPFGVQLEISELDPAFTLSRNSMMPT